MKKAAPLLLLCLLTFCSKAEETAAGKFSIAVVGGDTFDPVEKVLSTYSIPHEVIDITDLEKEETFQRFGAVFFPCGMEPPVHEKISIIPSGNSIASVSLKGKFRDTDSELIGKNISLFVKKGGAAYFSGFAFKHLQAAFSPFEFFSNHPHLGEEGRIEARLSGDLAVFCGEQQTAIYMTHAGWVTVESVKDGEVIAEGKYLTPIGEKEGPISVLFKRGGGEILYTSYHNTLYSDFRRFNIYKIAAHNLIERTAGKAEEQEILAKIGDAVHKGEHVRTYRLPVKSGHNDLYITAESAGFQADVLSASKKIIESRDSFDKELNFSIEADDDSYCFVKIFPRKNTYFSRYAIVSAAGMRALPYYIKVPLIALIILAAAAACFMVFTKIGRPGYISKPRRIF